MAAGYKKKGANGPKLICKNKDCLKLGRYQSSNNFYKAKNMNTPYYPYCKQCVEKIIDINNNRDLYAFFKSLDKPFILDIWKKICIENDSKYIEKYLVEINTSIYKSKGYNESVFESNPEEDIIKETKIEWDDDWQGEYTEKELKYLNDYLNKIKETFDVTNVNHTDYAKEIARISLLKNRAYNKMMEDPSKENIEAYKALVSMFDTLSKSAQFAESQRSANDVGLGSFGQIFDAVESHNWVPPYVPEDLDIYDKLLAQFSNIEKSVK